MSMRATDPILGPSRGSVDDAIAALDRPDATDGEFVAALHDCARVAGIDWSIACTQAFHETADLTSTRWRRDRNPAGIGISADHSPQPFTIPDGFAAARLHIQCLYALAARELHPDVPLWPEAERWIREVWLGRHIFDPAFPGVRVVGDLNKRYRDHTGDMQATWAWDDLYTAKLVARAARVFPNLPDVRQADTKETTMSRGRVPRPPMMEHYQARINAIAGLNCSEIPRPIVGTAWHTEVGTFLGTASWFDNPYNGALTDFQIGCPADGTYDGVIMRFIEDDQAVAPYANGVVGQIRQPFDDALVFLNEFGRGEAINARLRSIELSDGGQPDRDRELTGRQIESLAFLTAYIHSEEAGQGWDAIRHNVLHYQTGTDHVGCPGAWLKANKAAVRERVVEITRAYQTNSSLDRPLLVTYPPGYAGPQIPQPGQGKESPPKGKPSKNGYAAPLELPFLQDPAELARGIDRKVGKRTYYALRRVWTTTKETPRYRDGSATRVIGPPIEEGTTFVGEFVCQENGEWWVVTKYRSHVRMTDLDIKIDLKAA